MSQIQQQRQGPNRCQQYQGGHFMKKKQGHHLFNKSVQKLKRCNNSTFAYSIITTEMHKFQLHLMRRVPGMNESGAEALKAPPEKPTKQDVVRKSIQKQSLAPFSWNPLTGTGACLGLHTGHKQNLLSMHPPDLHLLHK